MVWAVSKRSAWRLIYENEDYAIHVCTTAFLNSVSYQLSRVARLWVPLLPVSLVWILPHGRQLDDHGTHPYPRLILGDYSLVSCLRSTVWRTQFHTFLCTFPVVYRRKLSPVLVILAWLEVSEDGNLKKKLTLKLTGNILLILDAQSDFIYVYIAKWLPWC